MEGSRTIPSGEKRISTTKKRYEMRKVLVWSVTIVAGVDLVREATEDFQERQKEEVSANLIKMSKLLSEGYMISHSTPVRTDGWCGVQYLLIKELRHEQKR